MAAFKVDPRSEAAEDWGAVFTAAYTAPARHYHGAAHICALFDRLEAWAAQARDLPLLQLTAFTHDLVYDGAPGADERASAAQAEICGVALGLSIARIDRMIRWIEATAGHAPLPHDPDGQLFLDADLEILSAAEPDYDAYAAAIRREYAHVDEAVFRAGRAGAMRLFLERPTIYGHPATPPWWEARARANIAREIEMLDAG